MSQNVFDAHIHLDDSFSIEQCEDQMNKYQIEKAIVMPNPIDPKIFSLSANANVDVSSGGKRVKMTFDGKGYYVEKAYENKIPGADLPKDYWAYINEKLINNCEKYNNVFPYILLPVNSVLAKQILDKLEGKYYGKFFGLKLHPNAYSYPVHRFFLRGTDRKIDYPVIVHTGVTQYDSPKNALKFARQYAGNVCLAHCGRFDFETLNAISKMKNVFIDISPSYYLDAVSRGADLKVFDKEGLQGYSPTELLMMLISAVGEDKIIAGSDAPFGRIEEFKKLSESLDISPELFNKIFIKNVERFNSKAYLKDLSNEELENERKTIPNFDKPSTFGE